MKDVYESPSERKFREKRAEEVGLPLMSSWREINAAAREKQRVQWVGDLKLPKDSSWDQIDQFCLQGGSNGSPL